jgi:tetrathionate reductase subunit B
MHWGFANFQAMAPITFRMALPDGSGWAAARTCRQHRAMTTASAGSSLALRPSDRTKPKIGLTEDLRSIVDSFLRRSGRSVVGDVAVMPSRRLGRILAVVGSFGPPGGSARKMGRFGMLIDLNTCIGCHACSVACKAEFGVPLGVFRDTVKYVEDGIYPAARRYFIPVLCNHCEDAPCLNVCPTDAVTRLPGGEVVIEEGDCNLNRFCMSACPYGAIYEDPVQQVAQKCTLCVHRTAEGREPACVQACPTRCRIFGDLDDPDSEIARTAAANQTAVWKPDEQTSPRVSYIDPHGALTLIADVGIQADLHAEVPGEQ